MKKLEQRIKDIESMVEFLSMHDKEDIVVYRGAFQRRGIQYIHDGELKTCWLPYKFSSVKTIRDDGDIALLEIMVFSVVETKYMFVLDKKQNVMIDISRAYMDIKSERKETAERFAEMFKEKSSCSFDASGHTSYQISGIDIDEICEELSEGKV